MKPRASPSSSGAPWRREGRRGAEAGAVDAGTPLVAEGACGAPLPPASEQDHGPPLGQGAVKRLPRTPSFPRAARTLGLLSGHYFHEALLPACTVSWSGCGYVLLVS